MQKTYCDRCGRWCVNYHANLRLDARHTTSTGLYVDSEERPSPIELCRPCTAELEAWFGKGLDLMSEAQAYERQRQAVQDMPLTEHPRGMITAHP